MENKDLSKDTVSEVRAEMDRKLVNHLSSPRTRYLMSLKYIARFYGKDSEQYRRAVAKQTKKEKLIEESATHEDIPEQETALSKHERMKSRFFLNQKGNPSSYQRSVRSSVLGDEETLRNLDEAAEWP